MKFWVKDPKKCFPVLRGGLYLVLEVGMKKKLIALNEDDVEEVDGLDEMLDDIASNGAWLDNGEMTILLPEELVDALDKAGVLGIA